MAYMSQEHKKELAPAIKAVLKKYGVKASLSVKHHSTLVLNIKSSKIDFLEGEDREYIQVNEYHIKNQYEGVARDFLLEVKEAMMVGNFDKSDMMSDYFHVGWYTDINVGKWDKPYILNEA